MRLRCNMRFTLDGVTIHEVGEVIEREYEEVKDAIRDRALTPLPDLLKEAEIVSNVVDVAKNAFNAAVKQAEPVQTDSEVPVNLSDTSEVKED